jgi:hypothetical protein
MSGIPGRSAYAAFGPVAVEIGLWAVYKNGNLDRHYHKEPLPTLRGALAAAKRAGDEDEVLIGFSVEVQARDAEGRKLPLFERVFHYGRVVSIDEALASAETATPHPVLRTHSATTLRQAQATGSITHLYQTPAMESCDAWYYADPGVVILDRRTDQPLLWVPHRRQHLILDDNKPPRVIGREGIADARRLAALSL